MIFGLNFKVQIAMVAEVVENVNLTMTSAMGLGDCGVLVHPGFPQTKQSNVESDTKYVPNQIDSKIPPDTKNRNDPL